MASSSKLDNARFMQPLLPTFLKSFSIPKAFLEKELKGKPIESVVLTTDDQPHRHWLVRVEGGRRFQEGWEEFCSDHGLKAGDFLVFAHQLNLMFQVSVFDPLTACHRSFSSSNHIGSNTKRRGFNKLRRSSKANPSVKDQQLSCRITLSFYAFTSTNVYLPKRFVRESGLENRCCVIKLIGREGKAWEVKLSYRKYDSQAFIRGVGRNSRLQTVSDLEISSVFSSLSVEGGLS